MFLTVLGSGTCVPSLLRNAPGYHIEAGGLQIIVDCGNGTLRQLIRAGKDYRKIDAIFITHTHPDHISDLVALLHAIVATPGYTREQKIEIIGPKGLHQFYTKCIESCLKKPKTFRIEITEIEEKHDLKDIHVFSVNTIHAPRSIAYRFEHKGRSLVITGDCDFDQGIIHLAQNTDLMIIDCSFPDAMKVYGHLTSGECGRIANKAKVKKLLLSHIYPGDYPDLLLIEECKKYFDGDVTLAEDFMELDLR